MPSMRESPAVCLTDADVLEALQLRSGMSVAEIGSARFPEAIDRVVGPGGHVYAADTIAAGGLPEGCCDRVLVVNVWTEAADPVGALAEAARLLREGGRLVVIESRVPMEEVVHALEHNCWDVHRHGEAGERCYFIEAGVSDESVQS